MSSAHLPGDSLPANQSLERLVRIVGVVLVVLLVVFAGFYYWDRYIHVGDMSPVELGINHMERAVRENPDDPGMRLTLVQYYLENGNNTSALEQVQQVLSAYPDNEGALFLSGIAYTNLARHEEAIQALEKFAGIRRAAEDPQLDKVLEASLYFLGENYLDLNRVPEAIQALNEAIGLDPTDADAKNLLGNAYASAGQHEQAIRSYEDAVRFVPDFSEAYQGMLESYTALSMTDYLPYAKGMEAYSAQDYSSARQYLEQAVDGLPQYAPAFLGLGLTYERQGEIQLAEESLKKALDLDPGNVLASTTLARIQAGNH
jgi:protein O-GlcNAc transferase